MIYQIGRYEGKPYISDTMGFPERYEAILEIAAIAKEILESGSPESINAKASEAVAKYEANRFTQGDFRSKSRKAKPGYVYLLKSEELNRWKIGRAYNPGLRGCQLEKQSPTPISIVHTVKTNDPILLEKQLHDTFADKRIHGEWFELDATDVEQICAISEVSA